MVNKTVTKSAKMLEVDLEWNVKLIKLLSLLYFIALFWKYAKNFFVNAKDQKLVVQGARNMFLKSIFIIKSISRVFSIEILFLLNLMILSTEETVRKLLIMGLQWCI